MSPTPGLDAAPPRGQLVIRSCAPAGPTEPTVRLSIAAPALLASALAGGVAHARPMSLDPLNRVHAGLILTNGHFAPGVTAGLDSRLTRLAAIDVGGFVGLTDPQAVSVSRIDTSNAAEWVELRHGLSVTPGLRIPHRYGDGFNWDFIGRAGFGMLWSSDASRDPSKEGSLRTDPALTAGGDLLLRWGKVGVRAGGRAWVYRPYVYGLREELTLVRPQASLEAVVQW